MEFITRFISEEIIHALGWTVLHSLWQSVGVALLLAGAMLALQKQNAQVRYTAAYVALIITFGMAVFTFFDQLELAQQHLPEEYAYLAVHADGYHFEYKPSLTSSFFQRFAEYFNKHMPLIVTVWFMGVAFFTLRLLGGLAYIQHLKTAYTNAIPEKWQYLLDDLAAQIPVKRTVQLLESALVKVPMVIGHFKPVILLPIGAVNGLSPAEVEAILAHELAHIARQDYLLHLLQSIIEIFFYFNPAVWWMSALIRTEREHCCDDTAIALCGNQLTYAKALVALQENSRTTPNLAMTFATNKNQLLKRIQRILNQPQNKSDIMEKLTATCLLLAVLVGLSVNAARPYATYDNAADLAMEPDVAFSSDSNIDFAVEPAIVMSLDTLPKGNRNGTFSYDDGEKRVEAKIKDNKIVHLKIDGKEIPESEMSEYESMIEDLIANVPEPPAPPVAPVAPAPGAIPTPPAPPAPPARMFYGGNNKLTKEKDKDGNTIITIENGGGENARLEIKKDGKVIMDGKELKDGEEATVFGTPFLGMLEGVEPEHWKLDEKAMRLQEEQVAKAEADWAKQEDTFRKQEEEWRKNEDKWREQEMAFEKQAAAQERLARTYAMAPDAAHWDGNGTYVVEAVGNDNIRKRLEKELLKDGLIKNTNNYKFELSAKTVKVNGKDLPEASAKKYMELYEKEANFKIRSTSSYMINRRAEE